MSILDRFRNTSKETMKMVVTTGNSFYAFNGKLYQSDIVRACIRPKTKAIGKLVAKHIYETTKDGKKTVQVNPKPYIRFLLEEPNEYMSGQMLQEKVANQLALNNNAFILIVRDEYGLPNKLYPIPAGSVEAKYKSDGLWLKFYFLNGKMSEFPYRDVIHLRNDFYENDIFGTSPAEALTEMMNVVTTIDQGIINAIKNSNVIRWLLRIKQSMRKSDIKDYAEDFAQNFMSLENGKGVAAVDAKADAQQIQPSDYVPNATQIDRSTERIYSFFNTNKKIVQSGYTEDEWTAYYEAQIEPDATQMAHEYSNKLFSRKERAFGNSIMFESSNLTYASMSTKLNLVGFVDRGIMTPNEVRYYLNLAPMDGGDEALLRKDTGKMKEGD